MGKILISPSVENEAGPSKKINALFGKMNIGITRLTAFLRAKP